MENAPSSKFQFYKAPLKTVHSNRTMTIKEAYQYITSLEPMERTHILRSIKNKKEARKFKETDFRLLCYFCAGFSIQAICLFTQEDSKKLWVYKSRLIARIKNSDAPSKDIILAQIPQRIR